MNKCRRSHIDISGHFCTEHKLGDSGTHMQAHNNQILIHHTDHRGISLGLLYLIYKLKLVGKKIRLFENFPICIYQESHVSYKGPELKFDPSSEFSESKSGEYETASTQMGPFEIIPPE